MKTLTSSVVHACTPETFWRIYFDEAYLRALYLETLHYKSFELLKRSDTVLETRIVPKVNLPGPVAKVMGDSFAYENHGSLDRAKGIFSWKMVPRGKEVVSTRGTVRVEALGEGRCRRSDEVVIEAKVFGVGRLIEAAAEKEAIAARDREFALVERWIKQHPPAA